MKQWLLGLSPDKIKEITARYGLKPFAASQIAGWIYQKHQGEVMGMTNLSQSAKEALSQDFEVGRLAPLEFMESTDGTKKYLYPTLGGDRSIETVFIPDGDRGTLCVSSQAGCRMNCTFCMTARGGWGYNLSSGEILNQIESLPERDRLTNIVFMGMGEPLDNYDSVMQAIEAMTSPWGYGWSPTRITLSTVGITPKLKLFMEQSKVHLAVSLHNPFDDERAAMMPAQKAYPIAKTIEMLRQYDFWGQRRLSFEYIMFEGVNDTDRHLEELIKLLSGLHCRMNLIRFHQIPDSPLRGSSMGVIKRFNGALNNAGIITTTRGSRGEDIFAACGMLAGDKK